MTGLVPRRVTTNELWKLQGRTVVELEEAMKKFGKTEAEMVYEGTRATGVHTAANLLSVAGYIVVWYRVFFNKRREEWAYRRRDSCRTVFGSVGRRRSTNQPGRSRW